MSLQIPPMSKSSERTKARLQLPQWAITRVAKKGVLLGYVRAPDAEKAIKAAIKELKVEPQDRDRIAARQIVEAG